MYVCIIWRSTRRRLISLHLQKYFSCRYLHNSEYSCVHDWIAKPIYHVHCRTFLGITKRMICEQLIYNPMAWQDDWTIKAMGDLLLSISTTLTFTLIFTSKFQVFFFHLLLSGKNFGFGILFGSDCWTQLALIIKVKLNTTWCYI